MFCLFFFIRCPAACPWMWDNLTCWQAANVGEVVAVNCPEFSHDLMGPDDGKCISTEIISFKFLNHFDAIQRCWGVLCTFRIGEGQSKLYGVRLVWTFSTLHGHLLPLWQHYQTSMCLFTWSKQKYITYIKNTHLFFVSSLGHVLRISQSLVHRWI